MPVASFRRRESRLMARTLSDAYFRYAAHYESVLRAADESYQAGGEKAESARRTFSLEMAHILNGRIWAEAQAVNNDRAAELCSSYALAGAHLLDLLLSPREGQPWSEKALLG